MNSTIKIGDLRLSFIWVETASQPHGTEKRIPPFRQSWLEYETQMNDALKIKDDNNSPFQCPWHNSLGQHFWSFYFKEKNLDAVSVKTACRSLTPLRRKVNIKLKIKDLPVRFNQEAFLYPFGCAYVFTAVFKNDFTLEEIVNNCIELRRGKQFNVNWGKNKTETLNLDNYATKVLKEIRRKNMGSHTENWNQSLTPFSIATFVKAHSLDNNINMEELYCTDSNEIHLFLDAFTTWSPIWQSNQLAKLTETTIPIMASAPREHLLYGKKRARVIWFPQLMTQSKYIVHSLGCYHRNLVLASLQVESMGHLIEVVAQMIKEKKTTDLSIMYDNCAKFAAMTLARLYGNTKQTYRSLSTRYQMEQNKMDESINDVLSHYNKGRLVK